MKRTRILIICLMVVLCLSWGGEAEAVTGGTFTGNDLMGYCEAANDKDSHGTLNLGLCYGFIRGVWDTDYQIVEEPTFCTRRASLKKVVKTLIKYLEDYPQLRIFYGATLVRNALQEAFSCAEKQGK